MTYKNATVIASIAVAFLHPLVATARTDPPAAVAIDVTIVVRVVDAKTVRVDDKDVAIGDLRTVLANQQGAAATKQTRILLAVSPQTPYDDFMAVLKQIQAWGYVRIALIRDDR